MRRFDLGRDRLSCPKCGREIPLPAASDFGYAGKRTCECGLRARLQSKGAVDQMLQMGLSWVSIANEGKRIVSTPQVASGGKYYLIFEEALESKDS